MPLCLQEAVHITQLWICISSVSEYTLCIFILESVHWLVWVWDTLQNWNASLPPLYLFCSVIFMKYNDPFHKAFLKHLKSIIVSPVQLWKVFWSQKKKLPWKLTQTWKVTHRKMESREVEIWELQQNSNFLMSICTCSVGFLFGHGFRAPVYLQLCSASSALSFTQRERFSHTRKMPPLQMGNGADTHKDAARIIYHISIAATYCKRQFRTPWAYPPRYISAVYLRPWWMNRSCLGNEFNTSICK